LKRTKKIGAGGKLQAVDLDPPILQVLDHLSVVQITAGDLLQRTVDDEQQPHSLRMDVGSPGDLGFPDLHLKLDDGLQRKAAPVQLLDKSRMDIVGHVLHAHLAIFEELQIVEKFALNLICQILKLLLHYGDIHGETVLIQHVGRADPLHNVFVLMRLGFLVKITDKEMTRRELALDAYLIHGSLLLYGSNTI
jgi:hypothetical protein